MKEIVRKIKQQSEVLESTREDYATNARDILSSDRSRRDFLKKAVAGGI
ncbi:MAG: hypothetical protein HPY62_05745, partial [Bacteroidales bacterium]|nr:hypothetical protein [Bacteroidales bacterium]